MPDAVGDNRAPRGKAAKVASEAIGRQTIPATSGERPGARAKVAKVASEAVGRPTVPPEFGRGERAGRETEAATRRNPRGQANGGKESALAPGKGKGVGGKRKALEAASAASKRAGRQRKPKGKA